MFKIIQIKVHEIQEKFLAMKRSDKEAKSKNMKLKNLDKTIENCKAEVAKKEAALDDYKLQKTKFVEVKSTLTI
jgi:predicted  nucleic acid-binding Zn-ribbon protein